MSALHAPHAVIRDAATGRWLRFDEPAAVLATNRPEEVRACLRQVATAVECDGWHAAGWVSYEAAAAFDRALMTRPAGALPLIWFGLFREPTAVVLPPATEVPPPLWVPEISPHTYAAAFDRIQEGICEGDTYQVNFTYRLRAAPFTSDPWQAFLALAQAQQALYGAYVAAGRWHVCSASPELFLRMDGHRLVSRPMKGTAARAPDAATDWKRAAALLACEKNRAENLMIVDMVRNDLGKVARPGSVRADVLCVLESFPTVWQLTSTVEADSAAPWEEVWEAMFPPASITGTPKKRAMEIIAELESSPRQVYTGAIGFMAPGRVGQFNVAIRTLLVDTDGQEAEYGVGGGIVSESDCHHEQAECLAKARILSHPPPPTFSLLETMLWSPARDIRLLERHLSRMRESARYFGFVFDEARIRNHLAKRLAELPRSPRRLRLLLATDGGPTLEDEPFEPAAADLCRVAIARHPVNRQNPFLYHKTTHRRVYDEARVDFPDHDDVLLYNECGEVTETTIGNLVMDLGGRLLTPPVSCGLLPGTARAEGLAAGELHEQVIRLDQLHEASPLFRLNAVRGRQPIFLDFASV